MSTASEETAAMDKEFVTSIARAMAVLEAFNEERPDMTLAEISALTGFTPATARRCLHTLLVTGYIRQSGRKFRLGPRVLALANGFTAANRIDELVQRELQRLVDAFGDPSSVAMLDATQVVYVATIAKPTALRPSARVGTRYPAHATSLGKVLLAADEEARARYLTLPFLEQPTPNALSDPEALRKCLLDVARQGFAVSIDELDFGVASVAVPIVGPDGRVVAAINSSGYSGHNSYADLVSKRVDLLRECARAITTRMREERASFS